MNLIIKNNKYILYLIINCISFYLYNYININNIINVNKQYGRLSLKIFKFNE